MRSISYQQSNSQMNNLKFNIRDGKQQTKDQRQLVDDSLRFIDHYPQTVNNQNSLRSPPIETSPVQYLEVNLVKSESRRYNKNDLLSDRLENKQRLLFNHQKQNLNKQLSLIKEDTQSVRGGAESSSVQSPTAQETRIHSEFEEVYKKSTDNLFQFVPVSRNEEDKNNASQKSHSNKQHKYNIWKS